MRYSIILAAGEGKRMKSTTPKVLHKVCGKEMVNHVIDTMYKADIKDVNVIVGKGAEMVKKGTESRNVSYSFQDKQLGTGHAVICASDFLNDKEGVVVIFTGDAPLITEETVRDLLTQHEDGKFASVMLTSVIDNPNGYGRVIRNGENVEKIVEHKDCNAEQLQVKEINAGMYSFDIALLKQSLGKLSNNNAQGEYYLTDVIGILVNEGYKVGALSIPFEQTLGVNSKVELAMAEEIMRKRINKKHMENGVTLIDPNSTYIGSEVVIGEDCIIYPNNILEGNTVIEKEVTLYHNNRISCSKVGTKSTIQTSVVVDSVIGEKTDVGPFAYIRPNSNIGSHVKIGDFVEVKNATIGNNTKVSHLTYIGDAEIGEDCNFGCGTITVNYDGKKKYKTVVKDNCFVGCNTNLVAPVTVEQGSYIAAGSTITKTVPSGSLAVARARQTNVEGWVEKKNNKGE